MSSTRIEQLIELYFKDAITPAQQRELAAMAADLTDEQIQQLLQQAWISYVPGEALPGNLSENILATIFSGEKNVEAASMMQPVEANPALPAIPRQKRNRVWIIITAISAAAAMLLWMLKTPAIEKTQPASKTFSSINGERKNFQLPDGSAVTLNGGSTITIGADYGVNKRDIYLDGEAFFDVKHNKDIPFIVHTPGMDVRAVGTSFDVKAYTAEATTETALISGVIEVTLNQAQHRKLTLHPNQKLSWTNANAIAIKNEADKPVADTGFAINLEKLVQPIIKTEEGIITETAWKENKLVFTNERFDAIAAVLERWYGVKIQFMDDTIRNYRFTGVFEKEELESVLGILKETRDFNYTTETGETKNIKIHQ